MAKLQFADGTFLTNAQVNQKSVSQTGTTGNDYLYGSDSNDVIDGLAGNDYISAGEGNNTVKGGLGDDNISAGVGNDSLDGGDGNDNIQGGAGTNTLKGGIGNDTISGAGTLSGGTDNDVLTGYNGTTDSFIFNVGDGADTISTYESAGTPSDVLKFGAGITAANLKLQRTGYDLIFKVGTNGDQVQVTNWYYGAYYQLAKLQFADGTFLTNAQVNQKSVSQTGTAGNDYLYGSDSNDIIDGLAGNDYISAGEGNNTVNGGLGDDNIQSGAGNDILTGSGGKDVFAGGLGSDRFDYRNLSDSLLANFDIITDFNAATGNDLFRVITPRTAFVNGGTVATLDTAGISAKLTTAFFAANATAQFALGSRTFVAINDATAGFNASTDAIIELTGLTGTLGLTNFTTA